ncbi:Metalloenzyme, LuxS/M16 peptidase-like protein [Tribonema minus]|uniref:Metalloenzyme, LuxS/M16 peptidase-like protein n=1 Tax=Tribonema minus TaxID=303371 RepID=A0A836CLR7_9STRA|nr:Metalloenzyme, LuxS/M16 peptidase-like protein [Tribonema minus]
MSKEVRDAVKGFLRSLCCGVCCLCCECFTTIDGDHQYTDELPSHERTGGVPQKPLTAPYWPYFFTSASAGTEVLLGRRSTAVPSTTCADDLNAQYRQMGSVRKSTRPFKPRDPDEMADVEGGMGGAGGAAQKPLSADVGGGTRLQAALVRAASNVSAAVAHREFRDRCQSSSLFRLSLRGGALAVGGTYAASKDRQCRSIATAAAASALVLDDEPTAAAASAAAAAAAKDGSKAAAPAEFLIPPALASWPWRTEQGLLKSSLDHRDYKYVTLCNGLKVLLVHDHKADKAAAAMAVNVGAASDPDLMPGLAHFCEHMLFLGTGKYPTENAYKSYLAKHGGRSNASTSMEATVYQFEVGAPHLRGALSIFSQFFIDPLFTEGATDREVRAVDSEDAKNRTSDERRLLQVLKALADPAHPFSKDAKNRTSDERRLLQVLKALADPAHPFSKYSTGNLKTLRDELPPGWDTRTELLRFHQAHYHAPNMGCTILGRESLAELEALARECFEGVSATPPPEGQVGGVVQGVEGGAPRGVNGELQAWVDGTMNSPFKATPLMVEVEPLRGQRKIFVQWPLPPQRRLWRESPTRLLSHIWGSESPGSLFSVLQDRGLANSVAAGVRTSYDDFSLFQVTVALTQDGEARADEVLSLIHQYSRLVRSMTDEQAAQLWSEVKAMGDLDFRFAAEVSPYNYATGLARRLQMFPPAEILSAGALLDAQPDVPLLRAFLRYFRPDNTLTWRVIKGGEGDDGDSGGGSGSELGSGGGGSSGGSGSGEAAAAAQRVEKWYGVKYAAEPVGAAALRRWSEGPVDAALALPPRNEFIPDDFALRAGGAAGAVLAAGMLGAPVLLEGGGGGEGEGGALGGQLWHKMDATYRQPRACVSLLLTTAEAGSGARDAAAAAHLSLLLSVLQKALAQGTYAARTAGLHWGLGPHPHGVLLSVFGYNQKVAPLLMTVLNALLAPEEAAGGRAALERAFEEAREAMASSQKDMVRRCHSFDMTRPDDLADHYAGLAVLPVLRQFVAAQVMDLMRPDDLADYYAALAVLPPRPVAASLAAAQAATLDDVLAAHARLLRRAYPLCLVHGNADAREARELYAAARGALAAAGVAAVPEAEFPAVRVGALPKGGGRVRVRAPVGSAAEQNSAFVAYWQNSAFVAYWQMGKREEKQAATALVLSAAMREPCFTALRTQQQLGYVVSSGLRAYGRRGLMQGFCIRVLSKDHDPDVIAARVDQFLLDFRQHLVDMPEETFQHHVAALISKQMEAPKTLDAEFALLFNELDACEYRWDRYVRSAERLTAVTRDDVVALLDAALLPNERRGRMDVHIYGNAHPMPSAADAAAAAASDANANAEEQVLELDPSQLEAFREGLDMLDTSLAPPAALREYLAKTMTSAL